MKPESRRWRFFDDASVYVDRFGLLLLVTVLSVVIMSLVDLRETTRDWRAAVGAIAVSILVGATLILSLRASGVARRVARVADVVVFIGMLLTIFVIVVTLAVADVESSWDPASPSLPWIVLSVGAPLLVVRRLANHRRATLKTILGAVSAYLLLAVAFNFAFLALDTFGANPFFGVEEPTTSFMYYSLVTLTTLGFGDLAPAEPFGRLLSTAEAVIGQVYLVTFVAMIVGLFVAQRTEPGTGE